MKITEPKDGLIRPVLGVPEMANVRDRLVMIYRKLEQDRQRADQSGELFRTIDLAELLAEPLRPRIDCVENRRSGLEYAARMIGETLGACGGFDLMHLVMGMVEDELGARGAVWLDHRWDGVTVPGNGVWVA